MFPEFADYLDHLELEKNAAETTLQTREREVRMFAEWCDSQGITDVSDVRRRQISRYVDHLVNEGYAYNTIINTKYSTVAASLTYCYNEGHIDRNPTERIERDSIKSKARDALSDAEKKDEHGAKDHLSKEQVYELAEEHVPEPTDRNELLVKLMFWTGVRVSELVGIDIGDDGQLDGPNSDVGPEKPTIVVYSPKTDEPRPVSYPRSEINPLLRDWVNHGRLRYKCMSETDRLFIGAKGPLTKSGVKRVINEAAENMGIQEIKRESKDGRQYHRVTPHLLRHSHAMHYRNKEGVSFDDLKGHLGHSSVDTTEQFYAEGTEDRMVETFGE
jgi:integrase/recombinase XerD